MKHILLEKAFVYSKSTDAKVPAGFIYNKRLGYWTSIRDDFPLIEHKDFLSGATKKCDIETGEDQKGQ